MIKAFAAMKKSAAKANSDCGFLDPKIENAISLACDEITNGRLHGQFVTDIVQGGSGIAMNHNANEVIANRANELLGGEKGKYDLVHPEVHVNLNQESLNAVLMAFKFTTVRLIKKLLTETKKLITIINEKIDIFKNDEATYSLSEEILPLVNNLEKDSKKLSNILSELLEVNVTIPNKITEADIFTKRFIKYLTQFVGEAIKQSKKPIIFARSLSDISQTSALLKSMMSNIAKGATDLLLLQNDNKIKLGYDAIMTIEVVKQISFYILGNDLTIQVAVESGQLDNNIYIPIIFACLFEMINLMRRTIRTYRERTIEKFEIV
jgi:aspartate ammonia-lyase